MASHSNIRPAPDQVLRDIADYVTDYQIDNGVAYRTARYCVMDAVGCALQALRYPACVKLLGPVVPGTIVPNGARVPGTQFRLDPVRAAFNIGTMVRWIDFNDAFAAAEGGHPSDNLAGTLATADYLSCVRASEGRSALVMRDVLTALIKAYEIQGVLSLENVFSGLGYDHVVLTRVATAAVVTHMLGGTRDDIINAVSNAWADGVTLKAYRQSPNTGTRKSWAGGDAGSRAVNLALLAVAGEMGYPSVLTARKYGFYDALFKGQSFKFQRDYGSYIIEKVMFKFVTAGNFGQTAVECAFKLHPEVKDRLQDIERVVIHSQEALMNIMDKQGPLHNPADRDHCVQYIVAVGMIYGKLTASDFEDDFAADPRIDQLRAKMTVIEDKRYTREFHEPEKRSMANALQVYFNDGSSTPKVEIEYSVGHSRRRAEGFPMIENKFEASLAGRFTADRQKRILDACMDQTRFETMPVNAFMDQFVI